MSALRRAVGLYIVAMTRRASGGTTDAEVRAAYEAMYDAAAAPAEGLDADRLAKALGLTMGAVDREYAADVARFYEQLTTDPDAVWHSERPLRKRRSVR